MIIRDYQDYQEVAQNCKCPCFAPGCGLAFVTLFCDQVRADGSVFGFTQEDDEDNVFLVHKATYSAEDDPPEPGAIITTTRSGAIQVYVEQTLKTDPITTEQDYGGGNSFDSPVTITYEQPVSYAEGIDEILGIMDANIDYDSDTEAIHFIVDLAATTILCQAFRVKSKTSVSQEAGRYNIGWRPNIINTPNMEPYIKVSWDVYLMSQNYMDYLFELQNYNSQKSVHNGWLKCVEQLGAEFCGTEPPLPTPPEEPDTQPQFIQHQEWESINGVPAKANAFELPIIDIEGTPEEQAEQNRIYVINNIQSSCYRSSRLGSVPTSNPQYLDYPAVVL